MKRLARLYRETSRRRGRTGKVVVMRETLIAETRAEAERDLVPSLLATYRYYWKTGCFNPEIDAWVTEIRSTSELTLDRVEDRLLLGSPDDIAQQIDEWRAAVDADEFLCIFQPRRGAAHESTMRALRLFAEGTLPKFAQAPVGAR